MISFSYLRVWVKVCLGDLEMLRALLIWNCTSVLALPLAKLLHVRRRNSIRYVGIQCMCCTFNIEVEIDFWSVFCLCE